MTLFFLSRAPPPPGDPQDVSGHIRLRDSAGVIYNQELSAVCKPAAPLSASANAQQITDFVLQTCGSVIGKSGRLLELLSTTKITCYKSYPDMPPLDLADGSSFHVAAQGVSNLFETIIPSSAVGDIQSIYAVTVSSNSPGWLGISQPADPIEALQPCPDETIGAQKVIHPCSCGRANRWVWILVAPATGGKDCESPPKEKHQVKDSADYLTTHMQSFCSNVPEGFMCPVTCNADRAPVGSIMCKNGKWQRSLSCRERRKVCVTPFKTVTLTTRGNDNLWDVDGVVPDRRTQCDLFSREGKKCQGTCTGGFGTGQLHCRKGDVDASLATTGYWQARNNFECNEPVQDSLYPRPVITRLEQKPGEETTIEITMKLRREENVKRSPVKEMIFKERRNKLKKSVEISPSAGTTFQQNSEADDPDEDDDDDRRLAVLNPLWSRRLQSTDTCEEGDFVQQGQEDASTCLDGGTQGQCWNCLAVEVEDRAQCWRGRPGGEGDLKGKNCNALWEGDFYSCRFVGFTEPQNCYARPPPGYCVKKTCAHQGGSKSCTEYDPPVSDGFCIGDSSLPPIDHAVIQYTCCDHNVVTYVGSVTGGDVKKLGKYELQVGATNNKGTSWSSLRKVTCAPLTLTVPDLQRYEIEEKCEAVPPQGTCQVTCANGYFADPQPGTTDGVYTCNSGLGEALAGDPPKCLATPGGNQQPQTGNAPGSRLLVGGSTTPHPVKCQACAALSPNDNDYATCRLWGDPHVSHSWRSNRRFDFQGYGVYRYATSETCAGGDFEVQIFQCQYKGGRNSVALGVAVRLNNGQTVYVNKRHVEYSGGLPKVEPSTGILRDSQGVNIHSDDKCAFINVNLKTFSRNPGHLHNVRMNVWKEDLTAEGVCGAPHLDGELIAPDGGQMIFTAAQHADLCNQCTSSGSETPPGCPGAPAPSTPGTLSQDCGFMAPLNPATLDQECSDPNDALLQTVKTLKNTRSCVVFTYLGSSKTCEEFCRDKGTTCVATVDDTGGGSGRPCAFRSFLGIPIEFTCQKKFRDAHCLCEIPNNPVPGDDVLTACANSPDGMTVEQAEAACRASDVTYAEAVYPPRADGVSRRLAELTRDQIILDDALKDCMVDTCSSDPVDRPAIIKNSCQETSSNSVQGCQKDSGLEYEEGDDAYPCNCAGVDCQAGEACLIVNDEGSCGLVPTSTSSVTSTTSETVTTSSMTSWTTTETSITHTVSVTTNTDTTSTTSTMSETSTSTFTATSTTTRTRTTITSTTTTTRSSTTTSESTTSSTTRTTSSESTTSTLSTSSTSSTSTSISSTTTISSTITSSSTVSTTSTKTSTSTVTSTSLTSTVTTLTTSSSTQSATTTSATLTDTTETRTTTSRTDTTSTSSSVTSTGTTSTTVTTTSTSATSSSSSSTTSSVSTSSTTSSSSTATTLTTTTTYPEANCCGSWVGTGGFITVAWNSGEVSNLGTGSYEWRVYYTKLPRDENDQFLVDFCQSIQLTSCDIYCLEPGETYEVRVNLVRITNGNDVTVVARDFRILTVTVPFQRAGPPEDLQVVTPLDHSLDIAWNPSEEQGNCTFSSWVVRMQAMNGGWLQNPAGCRDLTQFGVTSCILTGLQCDTPYQVQVKQSCENDESTSEWSDPIMAETLAGGNCIDPAEPPLNNVATTEVAQPDIATSGARRLSVAQCHTADYVLRLTWFPGEQQDSQFVTWNVQVFKLTIVAGIIDPNGNVQIPGLCQGILNRATTECNSTGLPFGLYAFSVQEISLLPETSSPMSELSNPTWIPRTQAEAPRAVTLSLPTVSGMRVSWVNMALQDCPFSRTKVELSRGNDVWFEPDGCQSITDPTASSCTVSSGLLSNTGYIARVSVLCDECTNTPTSQRTPCADEDPEDDVCRDDGGAVCYKKLDALRAGSCPSASSPEVFTKPRRQAAPTDPRAIIPVDSGVRVTLRWTAGQGSVSGGPSIPSNCATQSYQLEIKLQTEADWGTPAGCEDLGTATTCTAMHLQCNTGYDARVRASCVPTAASSDWTTFTRFSTANVGTCLSPASAPQLLRQTGTSTTSLEVSFTAGAAGDCEFMGFELQYRRDGVETWTSLPLTAGSLQVRTGPSCPVTQLLEDTAYFFRARELCLNGAPLNSPWGNTQEPLRTLLVPPVAQPMTIDPLGLVTGTRVPQRLMLFFETDLDLGDTATEISICPSLIGTEEAPGACECVSAADCASKCVSRADVSVLLMSARVLLVDFSSPLPRPLTACPYDVVVEEGVLKTQLTPAKLSPRVAWSFTYSPPIPVGSVTLHSATTTVLVMHVFWDTPMTVTCGVRDESGGLSQVSAPEDFTGARAFVEVRITGLVPFTQYAVVCVGTAIGDSILTASVTAEGVSTQRDTDDSLSGITLSIQALCSDDTETAVTAALFPPYDPSIRNYLVTLNADEMRTWCGASETEAVLRLAVAADSSSSFASVTLPEVQSLVQPLMDSNGQLPNGVASSTSVQVSVIVNPAQTGTSAPVPYTINFVLGTLDLQIESTTLGSLISLGGNNSATFTISVPSSLGADSVGLRIGPYEQTLTLVSSQPVNGSALPRTELTFAVDNLVAMGSELPVIITARPPAGSNHPQVDIRTGLTVSTNPPVFTGFETNQVNNTLSLNEQTIVTITGTDLIVELAPGSSIFPEIYIVSIPLSCNTVECQQQTLEDMVASGTPNLCSNTVVTVNGTLSCIVPPTGAGNLGLCLLTRSGVFSELTCETLAPPNTVQPQLPAVGGISQADQGMSSSEPFVVIVDGQLPPESVSQGFLQVWASPFDTPPDDPANPGPGFIPLCADAVITETNDIECIRSQDFDVSQIGSNPNVFVQTGQDQISSNLLPGALQIVNPVITRIERSHEFEVGQLQIIVHGENFGTSENGNMVCALESFGPQTQSLADLRLADTLGEPGYITSCEVVSHEDTKVVCDCITSNNQQSVLGTPVDQEYYDEKIPTSGDGRRLQEIVDLDTLALQLSPLPVAVAVTYQLDCEVLQRLNESCDPNVKPSSIDIPQVREWQAVRLRPCPAGEHRVNYTAPDCLQCQPGKYKSGVGPALSCSFCGYSEYMGLPGAGACTNCPMHETTLIEGATEILSCDCAPGFYRIVNESQDWALAIHHGVCQPCPLGAVCEGGDTLPYSAPGYWTPNRLTYWECFPDHACLQGDADEPNLCQAGREPTSRRCGQCATGSYAHMSECHICSSLDDLLSWCGLLLWPVGNVVVFGFIVLRQIRSNDMSRTAKQKRMMKHDAGEFGSLGLIDHGEFRMLMIMWTCLQTLWIVSLFPLEFTRFAQDWLWMLGMFAFDFSIFRPQCALQFSYFWKWLLQWGLFFVMVAVLLLVMLVVGWRHTNPKHDWKYISRKQALLSMLSASLLLFTLVHLRDDLIFAQCVACEDGKFCLAEQPVIECNWNSGEWAAMTVLSILDLCVVIGGTVPILALAIYKSWKWQHGDEIALSSDFLPPWYVYISEMLVERHIGYIKEVRQAVPEFEQAYKDLHTDAMRQEVWSKAIDIILAHEAERAEVFLRRVIRHLYNHNPRFTVIDEDSGATFELIKAILATGEKEEKDHHTRYGEIDELRAADIHHITLTLNQLLDTARYSIPGIRVVKRWFGYSWAWVLLVIRFVILTFAMLTPRDQPAGVPLAYVITKFVSLVMEASLAPYQWSYLNDWELVVHGVIYVFMMFVVSGWSDLASNVLLVLATVFAAVPMISRILMLLNIKDKKSLQDPTGMSVRESDVSYHIKDMADGVGTRSLGISTTTTESIVKTGTLEHVRKSIEMVTKKQTTVVEKLVDETGKPIERTTVTEETKTDAMTYSLDMTKSQVGRIMAGQPDTEDPPELEEIKEVSPEDEEDSSVGEIDTAIL